jgi:type II secretory pathway pseudopilin PulG
MGVRSRMGAFTSIELLVVIGVLGVLAAILLPALAKAKEKDIRVICMNNQKQLYTSLHIYCDDNRDKLPVPNSGSWLWDVPGPVTTAMLNDGCTKKTFYCPSTAPKFTDQENWAAANSLWNFGGTSFNIVGYSFAFGGSRLDIQFQNLSIISEMHPGGGPSPNFQDNPATRELIADVILSTGNSLPASGADNFDNVAGGFYLHHLSAHMKKGTPVGGNIAYKDGHVSWKKFDASSPTASLNNTKVRTGSNIPYFWW